MHKHVFFGVAMPTFAQPGRTGGGAQQTIAPGAAVAPITDADRELADLRRRNAELEAKLKQADSGLDNIDLRIDGTTLTMTVDLAKVQPTAGTVGKAGKVLATNRIATSHGNYAITLPGGGQGYISVNVGQYPAKR